MKTLIVSILLAANLIANCQEKYRFKGTIIGLTDNTEITLAMEKDTAIIARAVVLNQCFNFDFAIPANGIFFTLIINDKVKKEYVPLFLDKSNIELRGSMEKLKDLEVLGSRSHLDYRRFKDLIHPYMQILDTKVIPDSLKGIIKSNLEIPRIISKLRSNFISEYPNSTYTPFLIKTTRELSDSLKKKAFDKLTSYAQHSYYGVQLKEFRSLKKNVNVGLMAPDFASTNLEGERTNLYTILKKGRITLVDFWASWCRPCREENPKVRQTYDAFHHKGLNILSVSFDSKEKSWKEAIEKDGMPWYHVSDLKGRDADVHTIYGINGIPDNFLIDSSGKILARGLRGDDLYKKVKEILEESK